MELIVYLVLSSPAVGFHRLAIAHAGRTIANRPFNVKCTVCLCLLWDYFYFSLTVKSPDMGEPICGPSFTKEM